MFGVNVPEPLEFHSPIDAPPPIIPLRLTLLLFAHKVWSIPASAVPVGNILILTVSVTGEQVPIPVAVKTRITVWFIESCELAT